MSLPLPSFFVGVCAPFAALAVVILGLWVFERDARTSYGCMVCGYWTSTRWSRLKTPAFRLHCWLNHWSVLRAFERGWKANKPLEHDFFARRKAARAAAYDACPDEAPASWERKLPASSLPMLAPEWQPKGEHDGTEGPLLV